MSDAKASAGNAVVTGAASGVGQATAWHLAREGWRVAILGRSLESLAGTLEGWPKDAQPALPLACDIGVESAVQTMGEAVNAAFGTVQVLVNAAGTNVPKRALEVLAPADYHRVIDANLNGAYYCVQAFLPGMRAAGCGTIINVISDAAKQASPKAGPSYSMAKAGMVGLTQAINAEERGNGVRACALLPGDIDTPLLDKRPSPPPAEARLKMLRPADVAECALLAIRMPAHAIIEEILIRPR